MTLAETTSFMERIKTHYQEFVIDKVKVKEWYKALKDYSIEDVNRKLDEHLNNEIYGWNIPKINFLTKYLPKENEPVIEYSIACPLCKEYIKELNFDEHFDRCSSVDYLNRKSVEITGISLDKKKLHSMTQSQFEAYYNNAINAILKKTNNNFERKILNHIINGTDLKYEKVKLNL